MNKEVINSIFLVFMCLIICVNGVQKKRRNVFDSVDPNSVMDVTDFSVFYDPVTNETIKNMMPRPWYKPGWPLRFPFQGGACNCKELQCFCCTGLRVPLINLDKRTCVELQYDPTDSIINMEVKMNNESVAQKQYSARFPPPLCLPIVIPYVPPGLFDFCVKLFDLGLKDGKLHVCMDINTRLDKAPLLILHFDCMDMGLSGISLSKPSGSGNSTKPQNTGSNTDEPEQSNSDVYDLVTEESRTIGTLK